MNPKFRVFQENEKIVLMVDGKRVATFPWNIALDLSTTIYRLAKSAKTTHEILEKFK